MNNLNNRINLFANRFNAEKYLHDRSLTFREVDSENGRQLIIETCPFCLNKNFKGNIHANRLYIRSDDKRYLCYNCGEKGNIVKLLAQFESLPERSIVDKYILGDYVELLPDELENLLAEIDIDKPEEKILATFDLPEMFHKLLPFASGLTPAYQYLDTIGLLKEEIIKKFDIRYSAEMRRIVFPIWFEGQCRGWQGRDITGYQEPKYLINKGLQKLLLIYNYDWICKEEYITITEGPIDAIKSYLINGTCLFGKTLSPVQEKYLLRCPNLKRVYLCLDNYDPEAVKTQEQIARRLSSFYEIFFIELPYGKDAGEFSSNEMVEFKDRAVKYDPDRLVSLI